MAPGNETTLRELNKRPARPMDPIPELPPRVPVFNLDEQTFSKNVRSVRRGAAGGLSGMTTDHLRPLLDNTKDTHLLFTVGELLARGRRVHRSRPPSTDRTRSGDDHHVYRWDQCVRHHVPTGNAPRFGES